MYMYTNMWQTQLFSLEHQLISKIRVTTIIIYEAYEKNVRNYKQIVIVSKSCDNNTHYCHVGIY